MSIIGLDLEQKYLTGHIFSAYFGWGIKSKQVRPIYKPLGTLKASLLPGSNSLSGGGGTGSNVMFFLFVAERL